MQIGAQLRRTVIRNPVMDTLKLKIEMQIEMKLYFFLSVQQLWQIATLKRKLGWDTGLLNTFLGNATAKRGSVKKARRGAEKSDETATRARVSGKRRTFRLKRQPA